MGAWAGVAGASAILGLLMSGLLLEAWSWQSVFGLNVVLAAVAIIGTLRVIPESAEPGAPRLDLFGAVLTVAGLGALVYSVIEAPTRGWDSVETLAGIGIGVVVLVGFVLWELSRPNPLIDPRLFRHRGFTAASLSITVQFFAFFGLVFLLLQYLQLVRGYSPLVAALSLVPMAAALMPSARGIAPKLSSKIGVMRVCVLGLVLISGALVVLSRLDGDSSYWLLLTGLVPLGAGMGLAMTPATAAITDALPLAKQGVGSAMNDLARELGGALGIAVLGSVLQSSYRSGMDSTGLSASGCRAGSLVARDRLAAGPGGQAPGAGGVRGRDADGVPVCRRHRGRHRRRRRRTAAPFDRRRGADAVTVLTRSAYSPAGADVRHGSRGGRGPCTSDHPVQARGSGPSTADLQARAARVLRRVTTQADADPGACRMGQVDLARRLARARERASAVRVGGARRRRQRPGAVLDLRHPRAAEARPERG